MEITDLIDSLDALIAENADIGRIRLRLGKIRLAVQLLSDKNTQLQESVDRLREELRQEVYRRKQVADMMEAQKQFELSSKKSKGKKQ